MKENKITTNPRYANGTLRRKHRARIKAMGLPCHICGRPIHYDEPSDSKHPWSFVIDEVIPVARWQEYGFESPRAVAECFDNLAPAHYLCNARKGAKIPEGASANKRELINIPDGDW